MIWIYVVGCIVVLFGFVVIFGAPYVPSLRRDVRKLFKHLDIDAKDVVVDAGSGDGIVLREAARRGAQAVGYEINPVLVLISRLASSKYPRTKTLLANFWLVEIPKHTTYVYIFSTHKDRRKLVSKMQREADRLGRPLRLICYGNPLNDRQADQTFEAYTLYTFQPLHRSKAQV